LTNFPYAFTSQTEDLRKQNEAFVQFGA
jgi:hypothetical protein